MTARALLRAGGRFRARAPRVQWRYVEIVQVRGLKTGAPYAIVREVRANGEPISGRRRGLWRGAPFMVALTWNGLGWALPGGYEAVS